jgi:hypothetical protein
MKKCQRCEYENGDEADYCSECGKFLSSENNSSLMRRAVIEYPKELVSAKVRWSLWLMAWGGVILVTILIDPANLRSFLGFPVGFFGFLPAEASILCAMVGGLFLVVGGWIVYVMLSVRILSSKGNAFWMYYVVFCTLLALNVGGCGVLIHTASGIH